MEEEKKEGNKKERKFRLSRVSETAHFIKRREITMLKYKIDILEALKEKGYTSYKIRKDKLIGEAQLTKIRNGDIASKETLNTICKLLNCQPGDILQYVNID